MKTMNKTRGGRISERQGTRAIGRNGKEKRTKYDIIHKLWMSIFGQRAIIISRKIDIAILKLLTGSELSNRKYYVSLIMGDVEH